MSEFEENRGGFISSIDVLKRTGLSRATLYNYIKKGIFPHPIIKRPIDSTLSRAKRMGYFPVSVLSTFDKVIQYKKRGYSMEEIRTTLTQESEYPSGRNKINGRWSTHTGARLSGLVNESEELFTLDENRSQYAHSDTPIHRVTAVLSSKERAVKDLFQQPMPIPLSFSVLAAEIQDSRRICAELPPEVYFRLINKIWICVGSVLKKYFGIYGKHSGNRVVYYFLKDPNSNYLMNAILCALEIREKTKILSNEWKKDTGWCHGLFINVGINEGYEYFAQIPDAPYGEFIILGDSTNLAVRLSRMAFCGSIWTTKNHLNHLDEKERSKVRYGIRRDATEHDILSENIFSRIGDLIPQNSPKYSIYSDISHTIVTEICNLR